MGRCEPGILWVFLERGPTRWFLVGFQVRLSQKGVPDSEKDPFAFLWVGPPVVLFYPSLGGSSPTKIDYRKSWYQLILASLLDLAGHRPASPVAREAPLSAVAAASAAAAASTACAWRCAAAFLREAVVGRGQFSDLAVGQHQWYPMLDRF